MSSNGEQHSRDTHGHQGQTRYREKYHWGPLFGGPAQDLSNLNGPYFVDGELLDPRISPKLTRDSLVEHIVASPLQQ